MRREAGREILAFAVLFLTAFLAVSLYSARPEDTLVAGFFGSKVKNVGGPLGAMAAAEVTAWLGSAAGYCLVLILGVWGLALLFRRAVREPGWKIIGGILFLLSISSFEVALAGSSPQKELIPGGYYGQFCYGFLISHLERFGSYLMVFFALLVAIILATDAVVYPALVRVGSAVGDTRRWKGAGSILSRMTPVLRAPRLLADLAGRVRSFLPAPPKEEKAAAPRKRAVRPAADPDVEAAAPKGRAPAPPAGAGESAEKEAAPAGSTAEEEPVESTGPPVPRRRSARTAAAEAPAAEAGGQTSRETPGAEVEDEPDQEAEEEKEKAEAREVQRPPLKINIPEPTPPTRSIPAARQAPRRLGSYKLPGMDLLGITEVVVNSLDRTVLEQTARKIEETLRNFKIDAQVVEVQKGPVITQYEVALAAGIKVHKIMALSDDLAMALKAPSIRIVAPIPGKSTAGVEVPNRQRSIVGLRELLECPENVSGKYKIPLMLGKDTAGKPIIGDLGEMPHLLIAGSTGSGKSVCINAIIINILMTKTPEEVKLILVDPKMVELSSFEDMPHLLTPVVTDMKKTPAVLEWLVEKMEERYELLSLAGVRNITSYNALGREKLTEILRAKGEVEEEAIPEIPDLLPHYVMIIDELADLMMTASKEVEASITRLSQKSRAVGIHCILATQRPSVDVITGLIKANMPSRISFHVTSKVDSRTILDRNGADKLLGKGDLLYLAPGTSNLVRAQGTFISDREIREVVKFARNEAEPQFNAELSRFGAANAGEGSNEDEFYEQAVRIILDSQRGSVTLLQRQLQIGYTRASRLMEIMHDNGLVGPFKGSKAREVYYKLEEWEAAKEKAARLKARDGQEDEAGGGDGGEEDE
jgi:DNA segregation ATPase FtsK/SpoIIIE, S-DNA-T family